MRLLLFFFVVVLVAVTAGLLAYQDPGYVLIGRGQTTIELTLSLFLLLTLLLFLTGYGLLRFIFHTWNMPEQIRRWRINQRLNKARQVSLQGLINLTQGQWRKAEKLLTRHVSDSDMPLLNYLSAARAAQKLNSPERRDHYLAMAHKSMPDADFAVSLTQAELQFAHGQNEQALATLVHLHSLAPKHPHVLFLLCRIYQKLKSWDDLKKLMPELRKHKVLPDKVLDEIERDTFIELINKIVNDKQLDKLTNLWLQVPRELKRDPYLLLVYARKLLAHGQHDEVEQLIREVLRKEWQPQLIQLYGLIKSTQPEKQLAFAESLLKEHEHHPGLLLTLGRLCMHNDLWGKARSYLEASLGYREAAETYKELGLLMEYLNENALAAEYFRKGLLLAADESK